LRRTTRINPAMTHPRSLLLTTAALLFAATAPAQIIFDNFDDGNDTGWTRISPIGTGAFTFPGANSYQIHTAASPSPGTVGPGRAGSHRTDGIYTSFTLQVDIVDWDETKPNMAMGLLARLNQVGAGTTDGYSFTLDADADIGIARITNETPTNLVAFDLGSILATDDFRLIFSGDGPFLSAQIFNLNNLATPLATIGFVDGTYASGTAGLIVFDGTPTGNNTATAVFDNYQSAVPEPGTGLLALAGLVGLLRRRR